jgi:hypothetical protein
MLPDPSMARTSARSAQEKAAPEEGKTPEPNRSGKSNVLKGGLLSRNLIANAP